MAINDLKYCPKCGEETLVWSEGKKWSCESCDYILYHNCAAAVAVLISCGDEILFTRRNQEPQKGKLDLAGGFTDPNESAEHTCVRELKEELNIDIQPEKLRFITSIPNVYFYKGINYNTLDLFFEYAVEEKFLVDWEESEISQVLWVKKDKIDIEDIAFASQRQFFEKFLKKKQ